MKPRILHLIDSFDEGGSERQALQLVRLLSDSGKYEVYLASLKSNGVLRADIEKVLDEIPSYPLSSFYDRNAITQLRKFVRHLRASRIDVLHTHDFYTNIFGMIAGMLAGVKVRIASRRETSGMRSTLQSRVQQIAYSIAHQVVANSDSVRNRLIEEGTNPGRITVIHNGLEVERIVVASGSSRTESLKAIGLSDKTNACGQLVTIVANMRHDVKDYPMFLRAAAQVSKALPNVGFVLAGDGDLRSSIETQAAQLGLGAYTFFLGRCENLAHLLNVSDVCVLSSKAEGFSNSILEYMAAARPVVATDVGGAREAIVDGQTGYLVTSGDDRMMAERIISLLRSPEIARSMGERGRRLVEDNFSQVALLQNTEALYQKLLQKTARRRKRIVKHDVNRGDCELRKERVAKPLRILVVAPSLDILGGQAVQAARLIARLKDVESFEVGFLPINPRLPGLLRKLQDVKYLRTVLTSILYVTNLLRRVPRYDVVHIFSASYFSFLLAPTPAILIAKAFGKKALLNYHSGEADDHLARWPSAISTIQLADVVAVPSEYLVRVLRKFGIKAKAINNLIELDRFTFRVRDPLRPVFLSNRNFEKHYGVDQVLRAFALIQAQVPEAELIVAGDGPERASLEALAVELGLLNARFIGRIEHDDIVNQYQRADVYLNGSEIDNQPLSILEAFACGLPVVTTNAGGIPDMVDDGRTCFLIERGDYRGMANRALHLLQNRELAATMAQAARQECEKYCWPAVRERWVSLYRELVPGPKAKEATKLGKLRRMSFAELRVRAAQALAIFAERQGWSKQTTLPDDRTFHRLFNSRSFAVADDDTILERFRSRPNGAFFPSFAEIDGTVGEFRKRWPEATRQVVEEADRIVTGQFDLLGRQNLDFGVPINWQLEPVSSKSWPSEHWSRVDYLNSEVAGDKKFTWELNRHQHFVKLGQAYWLTRDERYAEVFVAHLESWMDANPPKLGINWASSLEIAFRSISWLWAFNFFQDSSSLKSSTFTRALKFLYLDGRHLETYLSTYFSPNTHLTGEALGLFYLGTVLPEFREAERWRTTGMKILLEQLEQQVRDDGVYFEQSSYYHRYTTDFYTHLMILCRANGAFVPPILSEKLQALLDHLMYIARPDGTTPLFGDDDGGRLVPLDGLPATDFRAALSTGAVLFKRNDYKFGAGDFAEETLWLLGPKGAYEFDQLESREPVVQSKAFSHGGYYVMRDGWDDKANYLLFDCGPHGAINCGHAHADALSFEVAAQGRPVLVDPGTHTYTGSQELRDWFRSSSAHNVLLVDGESSSVPAGPFSWHSVSNCEPASWISERRFDYVEGGHDGYERLPNPVTHARSILFLKNDYWLIRDALSSSGSHKLELKFHFSPDSNPQIEAGDCQASVNETGQNAGLQLFAFGSEGEWSREDGLVSHSYGVSVAAPVCVFSVKSKGSEEVITFLIPNAGGKQRSVEVREVEAIGGRAFEILSEGHCDSLLLRDLRAPRVETVRFASDFKLTWARFPAGSEKLPNEFLALEGQRLELDGKEILKSAKRVAYLVASRIGSKFRFEMDEGVLEVSLPATDLESLFASSPRPIDVKAEI